MHRLFIMHLMNFQKHSLFLKGREKKTGEHIKREISLLLVHFFNLHSDQEWAKINSESRNCYFNIVSQVEGRSTNHCSHHRLPPGDCKGPMLGTPFWCSDMDLNNIFTVKPNAHPSNELFENYLCGSRNHSYDKLIGLD